MFSQARNVMIDPFQEPVMPLSELRRHLPGRPNYCTLMDWCRTGRMNKKTRQRVKLEAVRLPAGTASSLQAYLRFIDALNRDE